MPFAPPADNCLIIAGRIAGACETRQSPAGVPISRFLLEHHSGQMEAGVSREARCRIPVVACGEALTGIAGPLVTGARLRVSGFVSRANYREGEYRLVLHAARIDMLDHESSED
ncbi:MAG: primosomal replication protein N [Candidatus Competibacter sp.]|nr:primosomal replication protein N [Candidatus Competibacter sp.]MDG4585255.1 primosomal replication protein N [Candidatus Competibacter sp.]